MRFERSRVSAVGLLLACFGLTVSTTSAIELDEVLSRFDEVQESIRTLSADFTETTHNALLKEPIVAEGRIYLTKPDSVRWEYSAPEEMWFVIAQDEYTGYYPIRKKAERRGIQRWREHLFRFLGLGQASAELGMFYNMSMEPTEVEGTVHLVLEPKRKRVRKRVVELVHFWIDASTYMPVRVEYQSRNGNSRRIDFDTMEINPELAANLYTVDIPSDVTVTKGFSAFSGLSASANRQ